jgi:hypothetical protein
MGSLVYTSLVRPILEYRAACWDPYKEVQIIAVDRVEKKAAKFANHAIEFGAFLKACSR